MLKIKLFVGMLNWEQASNLYACLLMSERSTVSFEDAKLKATQINAEQLPNYLEIKLAAALLEQ